MPISEGMPNFLKNWESTNFDMGFQKKKNISSRYGRSKIFLLFVKQQKFVFCLTSIYSDKCVFNKVHLELFVKEDFVLKKLLKNITIGYVIKIIISKERERVK
jgi:hypothetical protein